MDHLPYPADFTYPPLQIPFLLTSESARFDELDFKNFPARAGWSQHGTREWIECSAQEAAYRAQAWLFFGALKTLLGSLADESSFVKDNACGDKILSLHCLGSLTRRFAGTGTGNRRAFVYGSLRRFPTFYLSGPLKFMCDLVWRTYLKRPFAITSTEVRDIMIEIEHQVRSLEQRFPEVDSVGLTCLGIRSLLWTLRNAAINDDLSIFKRSNLELSPSLYLGELLLQRGMCPQKLSILRDHCSATTLHYFSAFEYDVSIHRNCSRKHCSAYTIDESNYTTRHRNRDCTCPFVGVEEHSLKTIIGKGEIPIVHLCDTDGVMQLVVQPWTPGLAYTAISHTWSGGLGNPNDPALPSCQLDYIDQVLSEILRGRHRRSIRTMFEAFWYRVVLSQFGRFESREWKIDQTPFWIDTLCIPPWKNENLEYRNKALNQMDRVYAEAEQVIVLDQMLNEKTNSQSDENLAAILLLAPWMTRCWTFLEARLSRRLLLVQSLALSDPFVLFFKVASECLRFEWRSILWSDKLQFRREISMALYRLRPITEISAGEQQLLLFMDTWNELSQRTTSRSTDLVVILALMLDLSLPEIRTIEDTELQLLAILRTQSLLPLSFLFEGAHPGHLANNHCTWLPKNLDSSVESSCGWLQHLELPDETKTHYVLKIRQKRVLMWRLASIVDEESHVSFRLPQTGHRALVSDIIVPRSHNRQNAAECADPGTTFLYVANLNNRYSTRSLSTTAKGFILRCEAESVDSIRTSFFSAFECTVLIGREIYIRGIEDQQVENVEHAECVDEQTEIWLEQDITTWPPLQYRRPNIRKVMGSKYGSTHAYGVPLMFFELLIGSAAFGLTLIYFPIYWGRTYDAVFWVHASLAQVVVWSLCIFFILVRAYLAVFLEVPVLDELLMNEDYQAWTASFEHAAEQNLNDAGRDTKKPLSFVYQFHSWTMIAVYTVCSTSLLILGTLLDSPGFYSLTILGSYALCSVVSRMAIELSWRFLVNKRTKLQVARFIWSTVLGENREEWFQTYFVNERDRRVRAKFYFEPNRLPFAGPTLNAAFHDPMYLPEDYERERAKPSKNINEIRLRGMSRDV